MRMIYKFLILPMQKLKIFLDDDLSVTVDVKLGGTGNYSINLGSSLA